MIVTENLKKSYGEVEALRDVTFHVEKGEIVALLGGNGSGKSTSINIITGLLKADGGQVAVDGIDPVTNPVDARKKIGVFPDKAGLFPNLTVREHLALFGGLHGLEGQDLERAIERMITLLDLSEIIDRKTKGFSHGQTVKVALGRAMVHSPDFLILDEPTRGLDVYAVRQLRQLLLRMRDEGTGILFSSHVMQEVEKLSSRMAIIADGVICAEGSSEEMKERAQTVSLEDAFMVLVEKGVGHV